MPQGISELQLTLLAIGVLAVVGVWLYNLWQDRQHRRLAQEVFNGTRRAGGPDVLMTPPQFEADPELAAPDTPDTPDTPDAPDTPDTSTVPDEMPSPLPVGRDTRSEPVIDARTDTLAVDSRLEPVLAEMPPLEDIEAEAETTAPPIVVSHAPDLAIEPAAPGLATVEPEQETAPAHEIAPGPASEPEPESAPVPSAAAAVSDVPVASTPPAELADPLIDCVVCFDAAELIAAPLFWSTQRKLMPRLAPRLNWVGYDENSGLWQRLDANDARSYRRLAGALQLADRNGSLPLDDLNLYCDGLRQMLAHYQAQAHMPVVADVMARARALDEFCASVDWRLTLNLVQTDSQGMPLAALWQLAEQGGLRPARQGQDEMAQLHAFDALGREQFVLGLLGGMPFAGDDGLHSAAGITLTLDVPRVADGTAAFERLLRLVAEIGRQLEVQLVDDQRQPISDAMLTMIRSRIEEFQQRMAEQGIPAGGARALRLYS